MHTDANKYDPTFQLQGPGFGPRLYQVLNIRVTLFSYKTSSAFQPLEVQHLVGTYRRWYQCHCPVRGK